MLNIPNLLSLGRIGLIPIFILVFRGAHGRDGYLLAAILLLTSGLTDILDGVIARRLNQITPLGKILDPLADKLTLVSVTICLWLRFPALWPIFAFFLLKEVLMAAGSVKVLRKNRGEIEGAHWFGKLYTVIFYGVALLIILYPDMSSTYRFYLLSFMGIFTAFTFGMYIPVFLRQVRD